MTQADDKLLEHVREAWRNACDGGYEKELRAVSLEDLAGDMIAYDEDVATHWIDCEPSAYPALEKRIVAILPQVMK